MKLSVHPDWVRQFLTTIRPHQQRIVDSPLFTELAIGALSVERIRAGLTSFYPLVESFPKLLALSFAKIGAEQTEWNNEAKVWLVKNLVVEREHAEWWVRWAEGFGISRELFASSIYPPTAISALNDYLWHVCLTGELCECLAAVNIAIEGATGEWSKRALPGIAKYRRSPGVRASAQTFRWLTAHASYDDRHPVEALELLKRFAPDLRQQENALNAATRALQYYLMAAEACYDLVF